MTKKLLLSVITVCFSFYAFSQNVGIGEPAPTDKLTITNYAAVSSLRINHMDSISGANAVYIGHDGIGRAMVIENLRATPLNEALQIIQNSASNTAEGIQIDQGLTAAGAGILINQGGTGAGIRVVQAGSSPAGLFQVSSFPSSGAVEADLSTTSGTAFLAKFDGAGGNGYVVDTIGTDGYAFLGKVRTTTTGGASGAVFRGTQSGVGQAMVLSHTGPGGRALEVTKSNSSNSEYTVYFASSGSGSVLDVISSTTSPPLSSLRLASFEYTVSDNSLDHIGVFSRSNPGLTTGFGIGVQGFGGYIGVNGQEASGLLSIAGVFATGDLGASGTKPFIIDHPLDPENKMLRHFALESNEVLNVYRKL